MSRILARLALHFSSSKSQVGHQLWCMNLGRWDDAQSSLGDRETGAKLLVLKSLFHMTFGAHVRDCVTSQAAHLIRSNFFSDTCQSKLPNNTSGASKSCDSWSTTSLGSRHSA